MPNNFGGDQYDREYKPKAHTRPPHKTRVANRKIAEARKNEKRNKVRKLRRFLNDNRLLMVIVGDRAGQDVMISPSIENKDGATINNPQHTKLLTQIVELLDPWLGGNKG